MAWVDRAAHVRRVTRLLREQPVVVLPGARQVGKTTLARQIAEAHGAATFFDAERRGDASLLAPATTARHATGPSPFFTVVLGRSIVGR